MQFNSIFCCLICIFLVWLYRPLNFLGCKSPGVKCKSLASCQTWARLENVHLREWYIHQIYKQKSEKNMQTVQLLISTFVFLFFWQMFVRVPFCRIAWLRIHHGGPYKQTTHTPKFQNRAPSIRSVGFQIPNI